MSEGEPNIDRSLSPDARRFRRVKWLAPFVRWYCDDGNRDDARRILDEVRGLARGIECPDIRQRANAIISEAAPHLERPTR